jgi:hypothetical protein
MNWEAIGAIGEILAAAAVVFSFVYLAAQIRQNTQQVEEQCRTQRQSGMLGARSSFTEWRSLVIQDAAVASIWKRGNESLLLLNEEERIQMDFLLVDFFWAHATIWLQMLQGMADESLWEVSRSNVALYSGPGIRDWWSSSPHRNEYPEGFAESIDLVFERENTGPEAE